jgi:hypothetical protein
VVRQILSGLYPVLSAYFREELDSSQSMRMAGKMDWTGGIFVLGVRLLKGRERGAKRNL